MNTTRITLSYLGILASFGAILILARSTLELGGIDSYDKKGEPVSVRVDLKELDSFTASEIELFKAHLIRDARWRVARQNKSIGPATDDDITTATLRNNRYGIWLENENVLFANGDNPDELKVEIHFGLNSIHERYPHSLPQGMVVTKTFADTTKLSPYLKSYNFEDKRYVSELAIERKGLVIHLSETSRDQDKNLTVRFLEYLRTTTASIKEKGAASTRLSTDSVKGKDDPACLFVSTSRNSSAVAVRGWLNPEEPGTITLEARGIMSGNKQEYWHSPQEIIGWSNNTSERFYFAFWHPGYGRLDPQQFRYVLTFKPENSKEERILAECDALEKESYSYQSVLQGGEES